MKIKSFMGRRLLLGLSVSEVAELTSNSIQLINYIERHERVIQELNELYDKLEQDSEK
jgi:hypothetical protein